MYLFVPDNEFQSPELQRCRECKILKPVFEFRIHKSSGLTYRKCKKCKRKAEKELRRRLNPPPPPQVKKRSIAQIVNQFWKD